MGGKNLIFIFKRYSFFLGHIWNKVVNKIFISQYQCIIKLANKNLFIFLAFLRDHSFCLYKTLVDIVVYDLISKKYRFVVVYKLLSTFFNSRLEVITQINQLQAVQSTIPLFNNANWLEREVWDMFGILFINHTDLRRILTDYNFRWHPLRKNFPTTGYIELFFDESKKKLSYIPVELYQEFREFQYNLSWSSL